MKSLIVFLAMTAGQFAFADSGTVTCTDQSTSKNFSATLEYSEGCRNSFMYMTLYVHTPYEGGQVLKCATDLCVSEANHTYKAIFQPESEPRIFTVDWSDSENIAHTFTCALNHW